LAIIEAHLKYPCAFPARHHYILIEKESSIETQDHIKLDILCIFFLHCKGNTITFLVIKLFIFNFLLQQKVYSLH